jgi:hypothetical protein
LYVFFIFCYFFCQKKITKNKKLYIMTSKAIIPICCTNGGAGSVGLVNCDSKYSAGPRTSNCNDVFTSRCTAEMIASGDEQCMTWCGINPALCNSLIVPYCSATNIGGDYSQFCQEQLNQIGGGTIDQAVKTFCASHPADKFCTCITAVNSVLPAGADPNLQAVLSKPHCYIKECAAGNAYKNTNMRNSGNCPPLEICNNTMNIGNNIGVNLSNISQTCNQSIVTPGSTDAIQGSSIPAPDPTSTGSISTSTPANSSNVITNSIKSQSDQSPLVNTFNSFKNAIGLNNIAAFNNLDVMYQMLIVFIFIILLGLGITFAISPEIFDF